MLLAWSKLDPLNPQEDEIQMAKRKRKVELIEKTLDGELDIVEAEASTVSASASASATPPTESAASVAAASKDMAAFKLQFFGREYVEERFPEPLKWADRFAQEWVEEGSFEFLPVTNPRAKTALITGIKNIRAAEKKVEKTYSEKLAPLAKLATARVEKLLHSLRH